MAVDDGYTVVLLHMNGTDASTTFTDESGKTWTAGGNAQIDTAQSKFGGASGLFDGTGDYIYTADSADFDFPGDFTIDFWVRLNATGTLQVLYDGRPTSTNGLYPTIYLSATAKIMFYTNSADRITGSTTLSTGTWYHVALARSGTSTKLFLGGSQEGSTYSDSNSYINGTARPILGELGTGTGNALNGWLDEVRISKGIARWTDSFTPPTAEYAPVAGAKVIWFS